MPDLRPIEQLNTGTAPYKKGVFDQTLSKKTRFEVFKRDKFTCQYCGAKAPDVILHVDHIQPVADGGANHILNLLTACVGCNLGKGARKLSDAGVIIAQQKQLEELQERRDQLEMMLEWQRGLADIESEMVSEAVKFWSELLPGNYTPNDSGRQNLSKLISKYGFDAVLSAMSGASKYAAFDDNGVTQESWEIAFDYIGRYCRTEEAAKTNPHAKNVAYIFGILKRRNIYFSHSVREVESHNLQAALSWDIPFEYLCGIAKNARSYRKFMDELNSAIDDARTNNEAE